MEINVSIEEWQHIQQMATIGELTIGMIHDLKNQLACIGMNTELIECLNEKDALSKYISTIKRQLVYANEMIELMLRVGKKDVNHRRFDLTVLMEDVVTFFKRASNCDITIKTYVDESTHVISGCQALISNSILNLCANAYDAIGGKGVIEISLNRSYVEKVDNDLLNLAFSGECSILTVRDTGCGIEADHLNDIFEPFFTTKDATSTNVGMGLANVIYAAREHGASITVESEVGVGTTFKLYFKAAA
ncbi:MAG: ATP-binding protein [Defluviitaleaceae bacterium]|nr:ATP-binding protein [Defluviitaleaceae bacterium]